MVTLPVTLGDPNPPNHPTFCIFCCLSYLRIFKFGVHVDLGKSQPMDDKLFLKGAWSRHVTRYKFLVPLKYLWNGLS